MRTPLTTLEQRAEQAIEDCKYSSAATMSRHMETLMKVSSDLLAALRETREELKQWTTWGIIEIAVRNPNIASYMNHWEDRAEAAERERDRLKAQVEDARMGHVRLDECYGAEATKGRPLYDRISAKIEQLARERDKEKHLRETVEALVNQWADQLTALRVKE